MSLAKIIVSKSVKGPGYIVSFDSAVKGGIQSYDFDLPISSEMILANEGNMIQWIRNILGVPENLLSDELCAQELGQLLYRNLISLELQEKLLQPSNDLKNDNLCLQLMLPDELICLPWEILNRPGGRFLGQEHNLALARTTEKSSRTEPPIQTIPIRMLAILANPKSKPPINLAKEKEILERICASFGSKIVEIDFIEGSDTMGKLEDYLNPNIRRINSIERHRDYMKSPLHIVHILAHTAYDPNNGVRLLFEDEDGGAEAVTARRIKNKFNRYYSNPGLILMNSCNGALSNSATDNSFAMQFLLNDIPEIIAMQSELPEDAANILTSTFYKCLFMGYSVDKSLQEARIEIYEKLSHRLDWSYPVLFQRLDSQQFFINKNSSLTSFPSNILEGLFEEGNSAMKREDWDFAKKCFIRIKESDQKYNKINEYIHKCEFKIRLQQLNDVISHMIDHHQSDDLIDLVDEIRSMPMAERKDIADVVQKIHNERQFRKYRDDAYWSYNHEKDYYKAIEHAESAIKLKEDSKLRDILKESRTLILSEQKSNYLRDGLILELKNHILKNRYDYAINAIIAFFQIGEYDREIALHLESIACMPCLDLEYRLQATYVLSRYKAYREGVLTLPPAWSELIETSSYSIGSQSIEVMHKYTISRYPITIDQYNQYLRSRRRPIQDSKPEDIACPVTGVSWACAQDFCEWLTTCGHKEKWLDLKEEIRLPTRDEWMVAGIIDPLRGERFEVPPELESDDPPIWMNESGVKIGRPSPVGIFAPLQTAGVSRPFEMWGNVWEWTKTKVGDIATPSVQKPKNMKVLLTQKANKTRELVDQNIENSSRYSRIYRRKSIFQKIYNKYIVCGGSYSENYNDILKYIINSPIQNIIYTEKNREAKEIFEPVKQKVRKANDTYADLGFRVCKARKSEWEM